MKSPIYILSCLLPLAAQMAHASPTPEDAEDAAQLVEERDADIEARDVCRLNRGDHFLYHKYPCGDSPITGRANQGDFVNFDCRYKDWYGTRKGWVQGRDKPRHCRAGNQQCH